jgi:hypothetical protein
MLGLEQAMLGLEQAMLGRAVSTLAWAVTPLDCPLHSGDLAPTHGNQGATPSGREIVCGACGPPPGVRAVAPGDPALPQAECELAGGERVAGQGPEAPA